MRGAKRVDASRNLGVEFVAANARAEKTILLFLFLLLLLLVVAVFAPLDVFVELVPVDHRASARVETDDVDESRRALQAVLVVRRVRTKLGVVNRIRRRERHVKQPPKRVVAP